MSAGCKAHGFREPCSECALDAMAPTAEERAYVEQERRRHQLWADGVYKAALFNAAQCLRWRRQLTSNARNHVGE
jgi:hypothetical protein